MSAHAVGTITAFYFVNGKLSVSRPNSFFLSWPYDFLACQRNIQLNSQYMKSPRLMISFYFRVPIQPGDPSRRPSILPGFVRNEVSLWNEIEALSKKPPKRHEAISIIESSALSLPNGYENDDRSTPMNKIGNRINSPLIHDVIKEETLSLGTESPSGRVRSPIDLLESVEQELEHHKKGHNISRSSSGRSNRSLKTKAEFVKYV